MYFCFETFIIYEFDFRRESYLTVTQSMFTRKQRFHRFFEQHWSALKREIIELFTFHPNEWLNAFRRNSFYPIFQKGDIDGLVALFIDNMATLLTIILSLQNVFDTDIIYGKIVPG